MFVVGGGGNEKKEKMIYSMWSHWKEGQRDPVTHWEKGQRDQVHL